MEDERMKEMSTSFIHRVLFNYGSYNRVSMNGGGGCKGEA